MPLIYKGQPVQLPAGLDVHVIDGRESEVLIEDDLEPMWFKARAFEKTPRAVLLHHTAGEGGHKQLYRTLALRGLSVHFGIDGAGRIIQYADLATRCAHAGTANAYSVGVEISNRGRAPALEKFPRNSYMDRCHSRPVRFLRFHDVQTEAAYKLSLALCHALAIPFRFPMEGGTVRRTEMAPSELATYCGLLGHLHVSGRKIDPSPHIMDDMLEMYDANSTPTVIEKRSV